MLRPLTEAKIDYALAVLAVDQVEGEAPPPGEVSMAEMIERCGVSKSAYQKYERMALAKFQARLMADPEVKALLKERANPNHPSS